MTLILSSCFKEENKEVVLNRFDSSWEESVDRKSFQKVKIKFQNDSVLDSLSGRIINVGDVVLFFESRIKLNDSAESIKYYAEGIPIGSSKMNIGKFYQYKHYIYFRDSRDYIAIKNLLVLIRK